MEKIYLRLLENAKMTNVENKAKVIIKILPEYTKKLNIFLNSFKRDRSLIWVIRGKLLAVGISITFQRKRWREIKPNYLSELQRKGMIVNH